MRKGLKKAFEITDAKIQFVSLVDKAANQRTFLLKKADDGKAAFTTYGRIIKADAESHYVTGVVYEPMKEDSHGNFMTEEEITKAAYWFAKNGDKVDLQHSFEPLEGATVVESWIAKADFEIEGEAISKGTWLMTVEVADESVWEGIEKGDITGFSMGGLGNYSEEDVKLEHVSKQKNTEKKGLIKRLAEELGISAVEKGAVADLFAERGRGTLFWEAFHALQDTLQHYDHYTGSWQFEGDESKVRESLEDFCAIITDILTSKESIAKAIHADEPEQIAKAGKKMSTKNKETLTGIYESLGAFLKEFDDPELEEEETGEGEEDEKKKKGGAATDTEPVAEGCDDEKIKKEERDMTKREVEQIVDAAIEKALRGAEPQTVELQATEAENEELQQMVSSAVEKALAAQTPAVTEEQIQQMVSSAVEKAMEPVLKSRGLPSNLNGSENVQKSAGDTHYLHGIL